MPQSQGWTLKLIGHICVHRSTLNIRMSKLVIHLLIKQFFSDNFYILRWGHKCNSPKSHSAHCLLFIVCCFLCLCITEQMYNISLVEETDPIKAIFLLYSEPDEDKYFYISTNWMINQIFSKYDFINKWDN